MKDLDSIRQPQPITITFAGDQRDIDKYLRIIERMLDGRSRDNVEHNGNQLKIYPAAVND